MINGTVDKEKPSSSLEDYLEAIAALKKGGGVATVTGLSEMLRVKKPSVDWALKKLAREGYVVHERYGDIDLTPSGANIAGEVMRRHQALYYFLTEILNVSPDIAEKDACRMEHALSRPSISQLEKFIEFINQQHPGRIDWENVYQERETKG
ncbi:iron-dependent repressor IdeR/DtxR [Dehalogenimonas sp. WBC-2]|nr:iron-dependent repressor IdeR/DtxR [Dehalogenimonas sp. WBC-2]